MLRPPQTLVITMAVTLWVSFTPSCFLFPRGKAGSQGSFQDTMANLDSTLLS